MKILEGLILDKKLYLKEDMKT